MPLRCALVLALAFSSVAGAVPPLAVYLGATSLPPGGTAHLQVFLASPQALVSGSAVVDLDPAIFGDILSADAYSATGDQAGYATIQGRHVDIEFASQTGGLGRLPGLPVFTITVPVLASAKPGSAVSIQLQPGTTNWADIQGVIYAVPTLSGTTTIGGGISISNVAIGGGLQPAGTVIGIDGTGFIPTTTVQIDGVALAATTFVSPQQIRATLAAPAALEFRRVRLQNVDGSSATFFPVFHGTLAQHPATGLLAVTQPIFPLELYTAGTMPGFVPAASGLALQNPSASDVGVTLRRVTSVLGNTVYSDSTATVPSGSTLVLAIPDPAFGQVQTLVLPTAPIRMVRVGPGPATRIDAIPYPATALQAQEVRNGILYGPAATWNWTLGSPVPAPKVFALSNVGPPTPFTVSVSTTSGGNWLSVSPSAGTGCVVSKPGNFNNSCAAPGLVTLAVDTAGLAPGTYTGTCTITPLGMNPQPTAIPVVLNIYAHPVLFSNATALEIDTNGGQPNTNGMFITSSADPLAIGVTSATKSGRKWLTVTTDSQTSPATVLATVDPALLGDTTDTGSITIQATDPALLVTPLVIPVTTRDFPVVGPQPQTLQFTAQSGQPPPPDQAAYLFDLTSVSTLGATWLTATFRSGPGVPAAVVHVDATGLSPGIYQGTVLLTGPSEPAPVPVAVTLYVWSGVPPTVVASPASVSFTAPHNGTAPNQIVSISTGALPLPYETAISTTDGGQWLYAQQAGAKTPDRITISVNPALPPGSYSGTIRVTAPAGSSYSLSIPVSMTVTPGPLPVPQANIVPMVSSVVNAASQDVGRLSPGEIVTLLGQGIGGKVLFDGVPGPLLYVSPTVINTIVPYEVQGQSTTVTVLNNGTTIQAGTYPVAGSAPGIFTLATNGAGSAAVLNQDNTLNGPSNPAARGSIIQIYGTGEGVTSPPGVTGEITGTTLKRPNLPVTVTIGGLAATVTYAGTVPTVVAGLLQVNTVVPAGLTPGATIPVLITMGGVASQTGVTISVR